MKQIKYIGFVVILLISVLTVPLTSFATEVINIDNLVISDNNNKTSKRLITNEPLSLNSSNLEEDFYYEIIDEDSAENSELILNISYSPLLIAPSSITVLVDDEHVTSEPLDGEVGEQTLTIKLKDKFVKKGFHKVTVTYYGVIKEGVCVNQDSSGNWLKININSYFNLSGQQVPLNNSLAYVETIFKGTAEQPLSIVIPNNYSLATLNSGLAIASSFSKFAESEKFVNIVAENDVKELKGNIIIVGIASEFESSWTKEILNKLNVNDEEISITTKTLNNNDRTAQVLTVTANRTEDIENKVSVLIDDELRKQLSGNEINIKTVPLSTNKETNNELSFQQLNISNFELKSFESKSQKYFFYTPQYLKNDEKHHLQLKLKVSETIKNSNLNSNENGEVVNVINNEVELVTIINGVPHSIDIRNLKEEVDGIYSVNIPLNDAVFKDNKLVELAFVANGLKVGNPCIDSDNNRWIYIMDDSSFNFSVDNDLKLSKSNLANFPFPFVNNVERPLIVLPSSSEQVDLKQLLTLYKTFNNGQLKQTFKIIYNEDLTEEVAESNHLIFIGGPNIHSQLLAVKEDLLISYENGRANLSEHGFINETVQHFTWIQPNYWNNDFEMIIFDQLNVYDNDIPYLDKTVLSNLLNLDDKATIAVKTMENQFFTNSTKLLSRQEVESENRGESEGQIPFMWLIVSFITLIFFILIILFTVVRKNKKKKS